MSNNNPHSQLYKETLKRLGEMLTLLKQGDSPENREEIKNHCQSLLEQGKKNNFLHWVEVMEKSQLAISTSDNEYKSTAKIIITEIQKAGKKVEQNKEQEITIAENLQNLVPQLPDLETEELEDELNLGMESDLDLDQEILEHNTEIEVDLWEDSFVRRKKITPEEILQNNNGNNLEGNYDENLDEDLDLDLDLDQSFADLDLLDNDESLEDWLEDDESSTDDQEMISAVFLQQQDRISYSSHPDNLEEINSLFAEPEDDSQDLTIDTWANNSEQSDNESLENDLDWESLDSEESDIFILNDELEEIDESINELSNLFEDDSEQEDGVMWGKETFIHEDIESLISSDNNNQDPSINSQQLGEDNLVYDNIEDLGQLITSENQYKQDAQNVNWDGLINDNNILLYYDNFNELEKFINSPKLMDDLINWRELEMLVVEQVEDSETKNAEEDFAKTKESEIESDDPFQQMIEQIDGWQPKTRTRNHKGNQRSTANNKSKELGGQSMRVSVKQLDNLNNLVGELVVRRNRLEEDQDRLRQFLENLLSHVQNLSDVGARMQDLYERSLLEGALLASRERNKAVVQAQLARSENGGNGGNGSNGKSNLLKGNGNSQEGNELDVLELDQFTAFHSLSQEVIELIVRVRESTSDIQFLVDETEQLGRNIRQVTTQLQEGINQSRMVAFAQNADRLPFPIRKIAEGYNKRVELQIEGREVLIDKMILEHIWDPLLQLAKNSVTHGIEKPEQRLAMGKPAMGRITVRAFLQGPQTVISVGDDGAGIDPEVIKRKAIEKELISYEEAKNLTETDIYNLLFHAGFTTKEKADSHAGRGVGLDIVRTQLNQIRGAVTIDSSLGQGTTFTIRLPLTLSIGKALCCVNDNGRIAFPMDGIEDTKDYTTNDIQINEQGQKCVLWRNNLIPYRPLNTLINYSRTLGRGMIYSNSQENDKVSVVFLRGDNKLLAVKVDQVLGQEEIVIKQISGPLPKPKGVAGATVRSDGSVMPIADVIELVEMAQGKLSVDVKDITRGESTTLGNEPSPVDENPLVLIVDDSITVREMLSLSFNKCGYLVEQARDGQEAWNKLRSGLKCHLIFCDIEMPRMNGLEFLRHVQEDEQLAEIPVAILSSRGAEKHQRIAAELGASAYLIKPYVEKDLLDSAQKMLNGEVLLANSTKVPKQKITNSTEESDNNDVSFIPSRSNSTPLVLIIDDSVVVREMLSMTFTKAGYQVEQARDGQDGWDKLCNGLACDAILCDIEMPRMNGLELLARMQQDENLCQIPVAMVTSRGAEKHRKIASELGAKAYFTKPYLEADLLQATEGLITGNVYL